MLALWIAVIVLTYWRTLFEERALLTEFPVEYAAYRRRVARLVPGASTIGYASLYIDSIWRAYRPRRVGAYASHAFGRQDAD